MNPKKNDIVWYVTLHEYSDSASAIITGEYVMTATIRPLRVTAWGTKIGRGIRLDTGNNLRHNIYLHDPNNQPHIFGNPDDAIAFIQSNADWNAKPEAMKLRLIDCYASALPYQSGTVAANTRYKIEQLKNAKARLAVVVSPIE